ncbi:hypothetical protein [Roseospira goensis]|uniref:Uncharacterized protein n=1 Tax=Roseospira goensis TaxID=391922 RepID=A0A7W6S4E6_9PROT|nr:hypothetical protein [Roseospira goensis]MBB4287919.1 hypothetical protein [Roseospira goensis]
MRVRNLVKVPKTVVRAEALKPPPRLDLVEWADTFRVIALLEDEGLRGISLKNFKRAQNRLDALPFFRGDETAAISRIAKVAGLPQVA